MGFNILGSIGRKFETAKNYVKGGILNTTDAVRAGIDGLLGGSHKRKFAPAFATAIQGLESRQLLSAISVETASIADAVVEAPETEAPAKDVSMNVPPKKEVASLFKSDSPSNVDDLIMQIDFESFAQGSEPLITPSVQPEAKTHDKNRGDFFATLNSPSNTFSFEEPLLPSEDDVPLPQDPPLGEPAPEAAKPSEKVEEQVPEADSDAAMIDALFNSSQDLFEQMDNEPRIRRGR